MKRSSFVVWHSVKAKGSPWLDSIDNVPDEEDLQNGVSRLKKFPKNASFSMSDDYPKDVKLADCFKNISSLLVVSERIKEALETIPGALFENELLPVKIINHKGRAEKAPYFIVSQLNHPACLDEKKSKGIRWPIDPGSFQFIEVMALDEKKVDERKMLFRVKEYQDVVLVRRELADKLQKEKFSGVEFPEIDGFDFLDE